MNLLLMEMVSFFEVEEFRARESQSLTSISVEEPRPNALLPAKTNMIANSFVDIRTC